MNDTKATRNARTLFYLVNELGFTLSEIQRLKRIESTLRHWATAEANGEIQRDETTGKPSRFYDGSYMSRLPHAIPDREAGALKRLKTIMESHPDLWAYHQGDCRGCSLYVGKKSDIKSDRNEIVAKAQSWGAVIRNTAPAYYTVKDVEGWHPTEEDAARAYLKSRGASIPARDVLPLDSHYSRGVAVCL